MAISENTYRPIGWRAWYTGGRVFGSVNPDDWANLPSDGVLVAAVYVQDETGRQGANHRLGQTVFWLKRFAGGDWTICCDSRADAVLDGIPEHDIKEGRWTSETEMKWARRESQRLREDPPRG